MTDVSALAPEHRPWRGKLAPLRSTVHVCEGMAVQIAVFRRAAWEAFLEGEEARPELLDHASAATGWARSDPPGASTVLKVVEWRTHVLVLQEVTW